VRKWLGDRQSVPGRILLNEQTPTWVRNELRRWATTDVRGTDLGPDQRDLFDREHGTMWGGSSNHGEDYGIAW
jgi:gamma-glutamyltranspeptidase/glutathione hydrolase